MWIKDFIIRREKHVAYSNLLNELGLEDTQDEILSAHQPWSWNSC